MANRKATLGLAAKWGDRMLKWAGTTANKGEKTAKWAGVIPDKGGKAASRGNT